MGVEGPRSEAFHDDNAQTTGGWRMADGGWQMADDRWRMADGKWRMADGG